MRQAWFGALADLFIAPPAFLERRQLREMVGKALLSGRQAFHQFVPTIPLFGFRNDFYLCLSP
jgi:hypothetical protein